MREQTIASQHIYAGQVVRLRVDTVKADDGRVMQREIIEHAPVIGVIALDSDGNIILERQYRKPAEKELLEIPAGGSELGETPEDAVRREMREETGYTPGFIEKLGQFYLAPGYSGELLYLFLVRDLAPSHLEAEDTADISLVRVSKSEALGLIKRGIIEDGKSLAGLLLYFYVKGQLRAI